MRRLDPQLLFLVFAGIAWLVKSLKKSSAAGPSRPGAGADAEAEERTRRVQEEVRRKIAERQAGRRPAPAASTPYAGPLASPLEAPRPVATGRPSWRDRSGDQTPIQVEEPPPVATPEETAALVRQEKLADQLRALNEADRAAQSRQSAAITASVVPAAVDTPAEGWLAELRQPQGVRRGILLREILGPPVCFR